MGLMHKRIGVRRSVWNAAQELEKEAQAAGGTAFSLAEKKMDVCAAAGDVDGARFWRDLWICLFSDAHADAAVEITDDQQAMGASGDRGNLNTWPDATGDCPDKKRLHSVDPVMHTGATY